MSWIVLDIVATSVLRIRIGANSVLISTLELWCLRAIHHRNRPVPTKDEPMPEGNFK